MHELGMAAPLLDAAVARAGDRVIDALEVRVGVRHRVVDDAFEQSFRHVAEGTVAETAVLTLVHVPVDVRCRDCAEHTTSDDPLAVCGPCGSTDVDITGGDDLILTQLTYRAS